MRTKRRDQAAARLEQVKAAAREAGIKLTHQRLEIFKQLAATEEHPDAETLYRAVRRRVPTVSLDTVYRTLWMLHDIGLVKTLGPKSDTIRFDANLERHHHYVCIRCGMVRDFESRALNRLRVPDAARQLGSVVESHVQVHGLCESCQRRGAASKKPEHPKPRRNIA